MHLALVTQHYWPHDAGGSGLSVRALAEGLVAAGHRVTVLAESKQAHDEYGTRGGVDIRYLAIANRFRKALERDNVLTSSLRQLYPEVHPRIPHVLRAELQQLQPDVLHTHILANVSTRIWPITRALGIPVVHTLRDYYLTCLRGTRVRKGQRCLTTCRDCQIGTALRRRHSRNVDAVIGISEYVLNAHLQHGCFRDTPTRIVIPNGIDLADFAALNDASRNGNGTLRVGYLGRLHPSKGVEVFVDAFKGFNGTGIRGLVAGTGSTAYRADIERRAAGLNVQFLGHVESHALLRDVDVLVLPSKFEEPFGRVVLEAYAYGVPVVCARRGGAQSLIAPGETGWLFEPDNPFELPQILQEIATSGISSDMREQCHTRAESYDLQHTISAHLELYGSLTR